MELTDTPETTCYSRVIQTLDKLYEFEHEPVPEERLQVHK